MTTKPDPFDHASAVMPEDAIFVAADEPLLIYPSIIAAERDLEAYDVDEGTYPVAFGPNGEVYSLDTKGDRVVIERTGEPDRPEALKALLLQHLERRDHSPDPSAALSKLVARAWGIEADFWRKHDPYGDRFGSRLPAWGCAATAIALAVALFFMLR